MVLSIYSRIEDYTLADRYQLNTIAKALWNDRTPEERRQVYGKWVDLYSYEPNIEKADLCLLTYHWSHYVNHDCIDEALHEAQAAFNNNKRLVVFNGGDHPAKLPFEGLLDNVILIESAGYRSTPGLLYHSAQPSYISDYLDIYCQGKFHARAKQEIPVIGFCGQASTSSFETTFRTLRLKWKQHQYHQGKHLWESPPFETTSFRTKILKTFENQPEVKTNFILRKRYRAGVNQDKSHHHPAKHDFVNNILDSDYTLCMRGGGNFSVRFYETLCLGRIPIFIDTDCLLPFQDEINYKAYFPWIDINNLVNAPKIVRAFHTSLSGEDFINLQEACRILWLEHMRPDGFHSDFIKKMRKILDYD